jgi:hypothetical protein
MVFLPILGVMPLVIFFLLVFLIAKLIKHLFRSNRHGGEERASALDEIKGEVNLMKLEVERLKDLTADLTIGLHELLMREGKSR